MINYYKSTQSFDCSIVALFGSKFVNNTQITYLKIKIKQNFRGLFNHAVQHI